MKDDETKIQEIKEVLREFVKERDWEQFHTEKDLAIAISVEAAEILEHFRFRNGEDLREYLANDSNKKEIAHELADVMAFLVRLADKTGIDLSESFKEKHEINQSRFSVEEAKGKGWMDVKKKEKQK
ncbi:nucleotide pyrophosphohydrolase [Candidatus Woesearchaeota archaeon]|nr:nucleotide pyrophosphohydrolase [Candidatus Woesearchaeota archaeon]|tara:strand:+ start:17308 stop:17688 length:381 start_codon:yes stop_codon:yes gene_type:complete